MYPSLLIATNGKQTITKESIYITCKAQSDALPHIHKSTTHELTFRNQFREILLGSYKTMPKTINILLCDLHKDWLIRIRGRWHYYDVKEVFLPSFKALRFTFSIYNFENNGLPLMLRHNSEVNHTNLRTIANNSMSHSQRPILPPKLGFLCWQ